ncbi:MAG: hypothetical protein ACTSRE_08920 [Promethearchaeota archaeon]
MKPKKKAQSSEENMDEDDKLMLETAKKNEKTHKCGTYRQNKAFSEE